MLDLNTQSLSYFGVPAFILNVDPKWRAVYAVVNQKWCDGTHRFSRDVIGRTADEVFEGSAGLEVYGRHMYAIQTGETLVYDVWLPLSDQNHLVCTTLTPICDASGKVIQLVGTSTDKTSEVKGTELQAHVETASSDLESFISMAAHDLRAPMRNVKSLANLLREDFEDHGDGKVELIDMLEGVAVKATDLITDILAHAQASDVIKTKETFDVAQLASDIFVVLDPLERHGLKVKGQWISSDKTAIQIALRNLCENAIKHCGQKAVELSVGVTALNDEVLEFSVQDNGVGFDDPALAFLDGGKMRVDSGFGLLGVRRLVTARGGEIKAENLSDTAGSKISFTMSGQIVPAPFI